MSCPPAQKRDLQSHRTLIPPYNGHRLSWHNVVAWLPIEIGNINTKVLGENFLAAREAVAATHAEDSTRTLPKKPTWLVSRA